MMRKSRQEYLDEIRPQAEQRIKRQLVLDAIADAEDIHVAPEELEAVIQAYAQIGQDLGRSDAQRRGLERIFRREKAITRLVELTTDPDPDEEIEKEVAEEESVANAEAAALAGADLEEESVASSTADEATPVATTGAHREPEEAGEAPAATTLPDQSMTETTM
jgi:trigger factor